MSLSSNFPTIKPSLNLDFANTKRLDPRVTFTRSTTGTYYDGVTTAKAEENLVTYSQQFDLWGPEAVTVSSNSTTAPDGTLTADTVTVTTASTNHSGYSNQVNVTSGLSYTFSFYAKKNASNFIQLTWYFSEFSNAYANFNLDAGTAGTASGCTSTITSVGNGWYRCTMTATCSASGTGRFYYAIITSATAGWFEQFTGTTQSVFLWGAQLEQRSSVTAYTVTTTQPITNYIPVLLTAAANVPRFDHNPTTDESLGLLIEEQRTNISLYSSYFAAGWTRDFCSVTANSVVAPDGTLSASTLVEDTTTNFHLTYPFAASSSAATYTASIYLKQAGRRYAAIQIYIDNASSRYTILVDLSNGSFVASNNVGSPTNTSYTITPVGNGWYRVSVTAAQTSTANIGIAVGASNSATPSYSFGFPTYTGNGWDAIYFWGAQLEAGGFATSYIATTAASATRNADAASMTGTNFSSWFNNGEGSLFASSDLKGSANLGMIAELGDGGYDNRIIIFGDQYALSSYDVKVGGAGPVSIIAGGITFNVPFRLAAAYKANDFAVSQNGATVQTDTSGTVPTVTALYLGYQGGGGGVLNGHIQRFTYYPARLTNAQLQALTS